MKKALLIAATLALFSAPAFAQGGQGQFGGAPQRGPGPAPMGQPMGQQPMGQPGMGQQPLGGPGMGQRGGPMMQGEPGMQQRMMPGRRLARGHHRMRAMHHRSRKMMRRSRRMRGM